MFTPEGMNDTTLLLLLLDTIRSAAVTVVI
jgi:hypothetical protein